MNIKNEKLLTLKQIIELDIEFYKIQIDKINKDENEKYKSISLNFYEIKIATLNDVLINLNDLL